MVKRHLRLPLALAAAVVAAEAAVLLLRPRGGVIPPVEVPVQAYFSAAEVSRAEAFRGPQTALFALRTAIELGVLVLVVRRPPRWLTRARRPVLAGAAAGALLSLATSADPLAVSAISRQRAIYVGLVTQSWGGWAADLAKGWTIGAVIDAVGGALVVVLLRRAGRRWWLPAAAIVVAFGAGFTYAGPVALDPLFNRF